MALFGNGCGQLTGPFGIVTLMKSEKYPSLPLSRSAGLRGSDTCAVTDVCLVSPETIFAPETQNMDGIFESIG